MTLFNCRNYVVKNGIVSINDAVARKLRGFNAMKHQHTTLFETYLLKIQYVSAGRHNQGSSEYKCKEF
jgi:hypothetical protein